MPLPRSEGVGRRCLWCAAFSFLLWKGFFSNRPESSLAADDTDPGFWTLAGKKGDERSAGRSRGIFLHGFLSRRGGHSDQLDNGSRHDEESKTTGTRPRTSSLSQHLSSGRSEKDSNAMSSEEPPLPTAADTAFCWPGAGRAFLAYAEIRERLVEEFVRPIAEGGQQHVRGKLEDGHENKQTKEEERAAGEISGSGSSFSTPSNSSSSSSSRGARPLYNSFFILQAFDDVRPGWGADSFGNEFEKVFDASDGPVARAQLVEKVTRGFRPAVVVLLLSNGTLVRYEDQRGGRGEQDDLFSNRRGGLLPPTSTTSSGSSSSPSSTSEMSAALVETASWPAQKTHVVVSAEDVAKNKWWPPTGDYPVNPNCETRDVDAVAYESATALAPASPKTSSRPPSSSGGGSPAAPEQKSALTSSSHFSSPRTSSPTLVRKRVRPWHHSQFQRWARQWPIWDKVQACHALVEEFERRRGLKFKRVVRGRMDTLWFRDQDQDDAVTGKDHAASRTSTPGKEDNDKVKDSPGEERRGEKQVQNGGEDHGVVGRRGTEANPKVDFSSPLDELRRWPERMYGLAPEDFIIVPKGLVGFGLGGVNDHIAICSSPLCRRSYFTMFAYYYACGRGGGAAAATSSALRSRGRETRPALHSTNIEDGTTSTETETLLAEIGRREIPTGRLNLGPDDGNSLLGERLRRGGVSILELPMRYTVMRRCPDAQKRVADVAQVGIDMYRIVSFESCKRMRDWRPGFSSHQQGSGLSSHHQSIVQVCRRVMDTVCQKTQSKLLM